jgi:PAT family beta-lactamase induction signal transducer AmpG
LRSLRWVGTLFFTQGLPASIVSLVSAVLLERLGVSNKDITLYVSLLVAPYSLKPLWSPLFESASVRRRTIIITEALMALALAGIAAGLGSQAQRAITVLGLSLVAFSAATHDIAADGLFVCSLPPALQKRLLGRIGVAFNLAKLLTQGMLVILAGRLEPELGVTSSWRVVFAIFALILGSLAVHHGVSIPRDDSAPLSSGLTASILRTISEFLRKKGIARLIVLVVVYRLAEGLLLRMAPLFLLDSGPTRGLGLTTAQLGLFYGGLGTCAFIAGTVIGGRLSAKLEPRRAIVILCGAYHLPALVYLALAASTPDSVLLVAGAILAEQFAYGVGAIGLKLILLRFVAEGPYKTAHFSFASGVSGVGATASGMFSGAFQQWLGYQAFFACVVAVSILVLLLTAYLSASAREA